MVLLQSCCWWKSVRKGAFASVIYTLVSLSIKPKCKIIKKSCKIITNWTTGYIMFKFSLTQNNKLLFNLPFLT